MSSSEVKTGRQATAVRQRTPRTSFFRKAGGQSFFEGKTPLFFNNTIHTKQQAGAPANGSADRKDTPDPASAKQASVANGKEKHADGSEKGEIKKEPAQVKTVLPATADNNKHNPVAKETARQGQQKATQNKEQITKKVSPARAADPGAKKNRSVINLGKAALHGAKEGMEKQTASPLKAVMLQTKDKVAAASGKSQAASNQLRSSAGRVSSLAGIKVNFQPPRNNGTEGAAPGKEQLSQHAYANDLVNGFTAEMPGFINPLKNLSGVIQTRIQNSAAAANAKISTEVQSKKGAVAARLNQARASAQARAAGARHQVEAQAETALASIQATAMMSQIMLDTEYQTALASLASLAGKETAQMQRVDRLYNDADKRYRDTGVTVGNEAAGIGNSMAAEYRSHKIHEKDSLTDGYLTDRRCEARAKAAEEVSAKYREELVKQANKQADEAMKGKAKDHETTKTVVQQSHESLTNQYTAAKQGIESASLQAMQQAGDTKSGLIRSINAQLQATLSQLRQQQVTHLQTLEDMGQTQRSLVDEIAQQSMTALLSGLDQTINGLADQVQGVHSLLNGKPVPDVIELSAKTGIARAQILKGVDVVSQGFDASLAVPEGTLTRNGQTAVEAITNAARGITDAITAGETSFTAAMNGIGRSAGNSLRQIQQGHATNSTQTAASGRDGIGQIMAAVDSTFTQLNTALEASFNQAVPGLEQGLRGCFDGAEGLQATIRAKAEEAAAAEQPAWKSIVKWVLIIAVVIVVALVVGPAVVGAVGAYLGAGTLATTVVAGAIVGAATSATLQVVNNVVDGRTWHEGVGTAALIGAVGGGVGGALGFGLNSLATQVGGRAFAQHVATQLVMEQVGNAAVDLSTQLITTGHISWHDFGVGVIMSLGTFGMSRTAKAHAISEHNMARGAAAGERVKAGLGAAHAPQGGTPAPVADTASGTKQKPLGERVKAEFETELSKSKNSDLSQKLEQAESQTNPSEKAARIKEIDLELHKRRALEAGLTPEQADASVRARQQPADNYKSPVQKTANLDKIYEQARGSVKELNQLTESLANKTRGKAEPRPEPENVRNELGYQPGDEALKSRIRAAEKVGADYPDPSGIVDIAGSKIVFDNINDLYRALDLITKDPNVRIARIKDRFVNPQESGYRDVLMNLEMSNGHIAEMRLHLESIDAVNKAPSSGHQNYKERRSLEAAIKTEQRNATPAEQTKLDELYAQSRKLHEGPWTEAKRQTFLENYRRMQPVRTAINAAVMAWLTSMEQQKSEQPVQP